MVRLLCGKVKGVLLLSCSDRIVFAYHKKAGKIGFWIFLSLFDPKWSVKRVGRWTDCHSEVGEVRTGIQTRGKDGPIGHTNQTCQFTDVAIAGTSHLVVAICFPPMEDTDRCSPCMHHNFIFAVVVGCWATNENFTPTTQKGTIMGRRPLEDDSWRKPSISSMPMKGFVEIPLARPQSSSLLQEGSSDGDERTASSHPSLKRYNRLTKLQGIQRFFCLPRWPAGHFIPVDLSARYRRHLVWAKRDGEKLLQTVTSRFQASTVFLSLFVSTTLGTYVIVHIVSWL